MWPLGNTIRSQIPGESSPRAPDVCLLDQIMLRHLSILHSKFYLPTPLGCTSASLLMMGLSNLGDLYCLMPPILQNTLLHHCSAYFSSNMLEVGLTLALDCRDKFTCHSSDLGLHGLIILSLGSSVTMTFFPHVVSAWLVRTMTLFSSMFIIFTFIGK
jgi:hypothetical protein